MKYHLTLKSSNSKTGPIPVSTSPESTCPPSCPMKNHGCYGDGGPLKIHWSKVSSGERGMDYISFCNEIKELPKGQLWRHNQVGDLVPNHLEPRMIDTSELGRLVNANRGKKGFTYTHYEVLGETSIVIHNRHVIRQANLSGFAINLSSDSIEEADAKKALNIGPVTVIVPEDTKENFVTPGGHKVVICPAAIDTVANCQSCELCAKEHRKSIIAFPAHGAKKKEVSKRTRFSFLEEDE